MSHVLHNFFFFSQMMHANDFGIYCCCGPCALHQDVRQYAKLSGKPAKFF